MGWKKIKKIKRKWQSEGDSEDNTNQNLGKEIVGGKEGRKHK